MSDTDKFYDVLLPFLTGKPLESSLAEEEERSSKHEESNDWRSPQKAQTASLRSLLEAMHYLLRRQGLSKIESKQVSLGLRKQFVQMMFHDLHFVPLDSDSIHLINIATRQLAYCTYSLSTFPKNTFTLEHIHSQTHILRRYREALQSFGIYCGVCVAGKKCIRALQQGSRSLGFSHRVNDASSIDGFAKLQKVLRISRHAGMGR